MWMLPSVRALASLGVAALFAAACRPSSGSAGADADARFVGSARCAPCHASQYAAWRSSQHAVAMQPATDSSVLGDFSGATYVEDGHVSRFFRRNGRFVVNTTGADGRLHDYEVRYTFGVYPLQQYLVAFPGGRLQPLTLSWDARPAAQGGQRWFALDVVAPLGPDDDMHWSGRGMNWNYMCADCHATAVRKHYVERADSFDTRYSELGVGCEGCHGPGEGHAAWGRLPAWLRRTVWREARLPARLDERRGATWSIDSTSGNARRSVPLRTDRELQVCAQCHARRVHVAEGYTAGAPLMDYYDPLVIVPGLYHADGQQEDEVYNHVSFLESRMHAFGVTCADCHDPHTQKLRRPGNEVCGQCHSLARFGSGAHHGHARSSAGDACASCHMPVTNYLEIDGRHDHSIRVPRPDRSVTLGVPNACNACHADRSAAWAAGWVRSMGGRDPGGFQRFAESFALDDRGGAGAMDSLVTIARDRTQPAVVRASALARLARHGAAFAGGVAGAPPAGASEGGVPAPHAVRDTASPASRLLAAAADGAGDTDPLVRRWALAALEGVPPAARIAVAAPLLSDPLRAVRLAATWSLAPVADSLARPEWRRAFTRASEEFIASQRYNADRAEHRVTLGAFFLMRRDTAGAVREFRAAAQQWPRNIPAIVNLAGVFSLQGREGDGERLIRDAIARMPNEAELHFELGRSLARQRKLPEAIAALQRAVQLAPGDARYAFTLEALRAGRGATR